MPSHKVRVSQTPDWKSYDTAIVSISHGQPNHEGDRLDSLLAWATSAYKKCVLNISDSLHAHNLTREGHNLAEARAKARQLGDEWLTRNKAIIDKYLDKFTEIRRWDDWLAHPDFPSVHEALWVHYNESPEFRAAIQADIDAFTQRHKDAANDNSLSEKFNSSSRAFLMEELAVYTIVFGKVYDNASRVYPSKPLESTTYLRTAPNLPESIRGMDKGLCTRVILDRIERKPPGRETSLPVPDKRLA